MPQVGEAFSKQYLFSRAVIAEFAARCGDENPLHFDEGFAATSRFGGIIACGPHANAVHMSMVATHYARSYDMVGLEFNVRFVKAIPADTATTLSWVVVGIEPNTRLDGELVSLEGKIEDDAGATYVVQHGRIIVWPKQRAAHGS